MTQMATIRKEDLKWMVGRAIAREEARLGAEMQNRLLGLPVQDIIDRASILTLNPTIDQIRRQGVPPKADLSPSSIATLTAIEEAPTPAELGDLGFIDAFFASGDLSTSSMNPQAYPASRLQEAICTGEWVASIVVNPEAPRALQVLRRVDLLEQPAPSEVWRGLKPSQFFCPPKPEIYRNLIVDYYYGGNAQYFGIDTGKPWRETRPTLLNIENFFKMIGDPARRPGPSYPWPGPAVVTKYWWDLAQSGLRELVRQPGILTEDSARLWVTLSVLTEYNKLVEYAKDYLEEKERKQRTKLIIKTVALIAIAAIMGYAIAAAMVAAGAAAATGTTASTAVKLAAGAVTESEKKKASASLTEAAKELQSQDPGFADQVRWSADYINRLLAEASRPEGPRPGEGGGIVGAVVGIGVPTLLSVGISLFGRRG